MEEAAKDASRNGLQLLATLGQSLMHVCHGQLLATLPLSLSVDGRAGSVLQSPPDPSSASPSPFQLPLCFAFLFRHHPPYEASWLVQVLPTWAPPTVLPA